jgi:5'-nucleotidase (lipoprotein e(P4) family)
VHWVRTSVEYRALCLQVYAEAAERVEAAAQGRPPHSWGVVLDADETVLDNSTYQKQRAAAGRGYTEESWNAWVARQEATAVPGASAFLEKVRALGGVIAIVTNRADTVCDATRANLAALGIPFEIVLCKPQPGPSDKQPRLESLRSGTASATLPPLEILAYVGDNARDFPGWSQEKRTLPETAFAEFGVHYFVVPNPMYGSWEANPER